MGPVVITVCGVGAEITKEQQPALPITPEELALDAERCQAAGASIYHLHVRDDMGRPTMDVARFRAAKEAIEGSSDLIVQFSSGGAVTDTEEARLAPLSLRPEMASLTTGTVNFGDDVFMNPIGLVERFYARMMDLGILPEFEIFEPGMLATAEAVYDGSGSNHHRHYDFVLGVPGAMPAWPDSVAFLAAHLPEGSTWSATGIGRAYLSVAQTALRAGGHIRTGFEDVRYVEKGRLAASNAELIERVADLARAEQREVATPQQARELLGIS